MAMKFVQLYYTYRQVVSKLSYEEKGRIFDAILDYAEHGTEPVLGGMADVVFPTFAMLIDRDKAAYEERCRKNRENAQKRSAAIGSDGSQEEENEKKEKKEEDTHYVRSQRAQKKRRLKNNSESTIAPEDLFVPFWVVEGDQSDTE